jgi:hypothetical protein
MRRSRRAWGSRLASVLAGGRAGGRRAVRLRRNSRRRACFARAVHGGRHAGGSVAAGVRYRRNSRLRACGIRGACAAAGRRACWRFARAFGRAGAVYNSFLIVSRDL